MIIDLRIRIWKIMLVSFVVFLIFGYSIVGRIAVAVLMLCFIILLARWRRVSFIVR